MLQVVELHRHLLQEVPQITFIHMFQFQGMSRFFTGFLRLLAHLPFLLEFFQCCLIFDRSLGLDGLQVINLFLVLAAKRAFGWHPPKPPI